MGALHLNNRGIARSSSAACIARGQSSSARAGRYRNRQHCFSSIGVGVDKNDAAVAGRTRADKDVSPDSRLPSHAYNHQIVVAASHYRICKQEPPQELYFLETSSRQLHNKEQQRSLSHHNITSQFYITALSDEACTVIQPTSGFNGSERSLHDIRRRRHRT